MSQLLSSAQLAGLDDSHLVAVEGGHYLMPRVARQFALLQADAREAGFQLQIASAFRSFERQLLIWNGKVSGQRVVTDDCGAVIDCSRLQAAEKLQAILRFSAIPGTSRHHWGTDLDVFDGGPVAQGYRLQLSAGEAAEGGVFGPLHQWLDQRMAAGCSHGFYRPYAEDRGGVAVERWHLSYAPLSRVCASGLSERVLREVWDAAPQQLLLRGEIERSFARLKARYMDVPAGWCPGFPPGS